MDRAMPALDHDKQSDARHTLYGLINTYTAKENSVLDVECCVQRIARSCVSARPVFIIILFYLALQHDTA